MSVRVALLSPHKSDLCADSSVVPGGFAHSTDRRCKIPGIRLYLHPPRYYYFSVENRNGSAA